MPVSDYANDAFLDWQTGTTAMPAVGTRYIAIIRQDGTEPTGVGNYARVAAAAANWNAASGSQPSSSSNSADITFTADASADWAPLANPAAKVAIFDAATAGNKITDEWLGNYNWQPFNTTDAAGDTISSEAHAFAAGDAVVFSAAMGGTIPTGLTAGAIYYVISGGLTADVFKVSTTVGGAAVDITASGKGMVRKVDMQTILKSGTFKFAGGTPGNLVLQQS